MLYIPVDKPVSIRASLNRNPSLTRNVEFNAYTANISVRRPSISNKKGQSISSVRKMLISENGQRKVSMTSANNKTPPKSKTGCDMYSNQSN